MTNNSHSRCFASRPRLVVSGPRAEEAADVLTASGALAIVADDIRVMFAEDDVDAAEAEVVAEIRRADALVYLGAAEGLDRVFAYAAGRPVLELDEVLT